MVENKIINTTVGRVILNSALPAEHSVRQRHAEEEGPAAAGAELLPDDRAREHRPDARRPQAGGLHLRHPLGHVDRHPGPDHSAGQGDPVREGPRRGHQGRAAVPRRRDHQRRALQQDHRRVVGRHREDRRRDVQRNGTPRQGREVQPRLHHGGLRRARLEAADSPAGGHARLDGQALGRNHRAADQGELPRRPVRARVLHLDARRSQGPGRHRAQDRGLGLPDASSRRRGAGRDRVRSRLRHARRHRGAGHRRIAAKSSSRCATASSAASRSRRSSTRSRAA